MDVPKKNCGVSEKQTCIPLPVKKCAPVSKVCTGYFEMYPQCLKFFFILYQKLAEIPVLKSIMGHVKFDRLSFIPSFMLEITDTRK
jgi:hypothetical protein